MAAVKWLKIMKAPEKDNIFNLNVKKLTLLAIQMEGRQSFHHPEAREGPNQRVKLSAHHPAIGT